MGEHDGEIDGEIKNPFSFKATLSVGEELLRCGQGRVRAQASVSLGPWEGQLPKKKGQFCFSQGVGPGCVGREMRERARDICAVSLDVQQEAQQDGARDCGEEPTAAGRSQGRGRGAPGMMLFPSYREGALSKETCVKNSRGADSVPRAH